MSLSPDISLIDLNKQFPFEIDDTLKAELCFAETLVISCGHYEGDVGESSESEWTCDESEETEKSEEVVDIKIAQPSEIALEEQSDDGKAEEEQDFHFYFFPDCNKPVPPQTSEGSLIVVDGLPKIKPKVSKARFCTCEIDKSGRCSCFIELPCSCGTKIKSKCKCEKAKAICNCHKDPQPVCTCKGSDVCLCFDNRDCKIEAVCTCDQIAKPCLCHPGRFPSPECTCKHKPKSLQDSTQSIEQEEEEDEEATPKKIQPLETLHEPCVCQKPEPKPVCFCLKGKECLCRENACICDVHKSCICELTDSNEPVCVDDDAMSVCVCPVVPECTCDAKSICECFPESKVCTCGNPEDCKCFTICECVEPCICDTLPKKEEECTCLDKTKQIADGICTCPKKGDNKLKKVKVSKHGYRWCHDVDPRHTFFDYAYDRHDKVSYKEQEKQRLKILGLHDDDVKQDDNVCAVHGEIKAPPYEKKVRKPSIDCCSAVGGISISVETLGEDKGKFLIQVVSHSSKEGAKCGSKLVSILDCHLHTMEENRSEQISKKEITKERRSYMAICEEGYYNKVTRICGERSVIKRLYHNFEDAHNFLLEGANIVLMRYFGLRRYRGNIKTETVLMDGTICQSVYVSNGVSQAIVNGKPLFVVKVERHIIEPTGYVHQSLTVLSLRGYMISHEWADNCYILHLNPLLEIIPEKDLIEEHAPLREKWRQDLQLMSDYLDFKSARSSESTRYVQENGSLTNVVRDYLQALLLLRPHDALHFTRHYFGAALSSLDLPYDEYFDPSVKHVRYYFFED